MANSVTQVIEQRLTGIYYLRYFVSSSSNGVGNVQVFGDQHAMHIWLNPDKLLSYNLSVLDISNAIRAQNTNVSAGQIGGLPAVQGQQLNATISAQSRLGTVEDFRNIIIRVNPNGSQVRLGEVAPVEPGSQSFDRIVRYKRKLAAGVAVSLATGANVLHLPFSPSYSQFVCW